MYNKLVIVKYLAEVYASRFRRNPNRKPKKMLEEIKKEVKVKVGEVKCCRVRQRVYNQVRKKMVKHFAGVRRFAGEILKK